MTKAEKAACVAGGAAEAALQREICAASGGATGSEKTDRKEEATVLPMRKTERRHWVEYPAGCFYSRVDTRGIGRYAAGGMMSEIV